MPALNDHVTLVAGGAGELGAGFTRTYLDSGAAVIVPSRSEARLDDLVSHLDATGADTTRLTTIVGNIGSIEGAEQIRDEVVNRSGHVDHVVASLGTMHTVERLTAAPIGIWQHIIESFMTAHFVAARTFLPLLTNRTGSTYTLVNGTSGVTGEVYSPDGSLLAVGSAGEHALMRALSKDADTFEESVRINQLVPMTPVITRSKQTTDPDWLTAEQFGAVAVRLSTEHDCRGETIGVRSASDICKWATDDGRWLPL